MLTNLLKGFPKLPRTRCHVQCSNLPRHTASSPSLCKMKKRYLLHVMDKTCISMKSRDAIRKMKSIVPLLLTIAFEFREVSEDTALLEALGDGSASVSIGRTFLNRNSCFCQSIGGQLKMILSCDEDALQSGSASEDSEVNEPPGFLWRLTFAA